LLFTDGVDTASRLTPADAEKIMEGLSDPLYAFGIEPPPRQDPDQPSYEAVLAELADASGGSYIAVKKLEGLVVQARDLRRELTLRYIISFEPSGLGAVKWRGIEVRVEGKYDVVARHGYRGTLP